MPPTANKKSILIVDDETFFLQVLTDAFEQSGWQVAHSVDGEEVFRKFTAYEPFGVLLDVFMPKLDGFEVCKLIKDHPGWARTHLVVMSSRISDEDEQTLLKLGADGVIRKPFDPGEAVERFEKAFESMKLE